MITRRLTLAQLVLAAPFLLATPLFAQNRSTQRFPDVVAVKVAQRGADRFDFDVTIASPYDTPQRYADAFRVKGSDGTVFGERILLHDHADEQPFTRDLHGVQIPRGITRVIVEGRDRANGYGGTTIEVALPER